jgi:hypothetical protein
MLADPAAELPDLRDQLLPRHPLEILVHDRPHFDSFRRSRCGILRPLAESATSCFNLILRVSSFFALTTHQDAVLL